MNDAPIIVIGAGGHALVLLDALTLCNSEILGLVEADRARMGEKMLGIPILGDDEIVRQYVPGSVLLVNAIGSTESMALRMSAYQRFVLEGYAFACVMHPSAVIARSVTLASGAQIMAGAVVQPCSHIGENSIINTGARVDHECRVGAHVHIAPGATLSGGVMVGEGTHVGTGATVVQGVRIGAGSTVAAGAVVLQDVRDGICVAGVPARELMR